MILWVPGRLPGLNELLSAKSSRQGNWSSYNAIKAKYYGHMKALVAKNGVRPVGPGHWTFLFIESDRRRDPDNIAAGGVKILFDALVGADVIAGDGWAHVLGYVSHWQVGNKPGCLVQWDERQVWSKPAMAVALEKELENEKR